MTTTTGTDIYDYNYRLWIVSECSFSPLLGGVLLEWCSVWGLVVFLVIRGERERATGILMDSTVWTRLQPKLSFHFAKAKV
jgi:hypothetical protein